MGEIDISSLSAWLKDAVLDVDGEVTLTKFPGGQSNPTYKLEAAGRQFVLRRKPFGQLLRSAHAVDREFRILTALHPTGFPVPEPVALCEDTAVIGTEFYIMEMVQGRNYWNGALPEIPKHDRGVLYHSMVDTLAQLHKIDFRSVGLADFERPGNYFQRQVNLWTKQYRASQTEEVPVFEKLIEWLPDAIPEQTRSTIIHGDYRIDNLIFSSSDPRVAAVLDWELATIGDPIADFTYYAMNWVLPVDQGAGLQGLDFDAEGIPALEEIVARYCDATGRDGIPDISWHFAYNLFRLGCILQGIKKRVIDGTASSPEAAKKAERAIPFAEAAWSQAQLTSGR